TTAQGVVGATQQIGGSVGALARTTAENTIDTVGTVGTTAVKTVADVLVAAVDGVKAVLGAVLPQSRQGVIFLPARSIGRPAGRHDLARPTPERNESCVITDSSTNSETLSHLSALSRLCANHRCNRFAWSLNSWLPGQCAKSTSTLFTRSTAQRNSRVPPVTRYGCKRNTSPRGLGTGDARRAVRTAGGLRGVTGGGDGAGQKLTGIDESF